MKHPLKRTVCDGDRYRALFLDGARLPVAVDQEVGK